MTKHPFDFIAQLPQYAGQGQAAARMNARHRFLIDPYLEDISGARVLDLGSHDGRWPYAFAKSGAAHVTGIEARAQTAAGFQFYPDAALRARVDLRVADMFDEIDRLVAVGAQFDVVAVFGVIYHVMDHFRLFQRLRLLGPRLILIDSEFMTRPAPFIHLTRERADQPLNAAPQFDGQEVALKGIPSFQAMEAIARALDFDLVWSDWTQLADRHGVGDYFRKGPMRRSSCALRPKR